MKLLTLVALIGLGSVVVECKPKHELGALAKAYNVEEEYIGCFRDDKSPANLYQAQVQERALPYEIKNFFGDKINCIHACATKFFPYAGLQNGYLCFCGHSYSKYGRLDEKYCNMKCRNYHKNTNSLGRTKYGEFWKDCGGHWANSVYSAYGLMKLEHLAQEKKLDDSWLFAEKK